MLKLSVEVSDNIGVRVVSFAYNENNTWKELEPVAVNSGRNVKTQASLSWDTSSLSDGYYDLRVRAFDQAGNSSTPVSKIIYIRTSPPETPQNLSASAGEMKVHVTWGNVDDADLDYYRLYRSADGGEFILLQETILLSYIDTSVESGKSYAYQVTAIDTYGHESAPAISDTVTVLPDTTPPVITGFVPADGSRINGSANISVLASDNVGIEGIDFAYSEDGDLWIDIQKNTLGSTTWATLNQIPDGLYHIRAIARDGADNEVMLTALYTVDNTAPQAPVLNGNSSELKITLTWQLVGLIEDLIVIE